MQVYLVGGAVRDALLGRAVQDRDWVVVGATPEQMLAQGFRPVGRDFPVFLHPDTQEEYALARTERKTGPGYQGFAVHAAPDVTLEQDLSRRDFTINSIALEAQWTRAGAQFSPEKLAPGSPALVDPHGGVADLRAGVLRHVSPAFAEDPVRILRLARFAARFASFSIAPETLALCRAMVDSGEVDHLVAERVWAELAKGLMESAPQRMFGVLRECGALARLMPELDRLWGVPQRADYHPEVDTGVHAMLVLQQAAALQAPLPVRFAALTHDLGKGTTPADVLPRHIGHEQRSLRLVRAMGQRLRVPRECQELAELVAAEHGNIHTSEGFNASAVMRLLQRCDALRKPQRFAQALLACVCDARGRTGFESAPYPQQPRLQAALDAALGLDTAPIAAQAQASGAQGAAVGEAVAQARTAAVAQALQAWHAHQRVTEPGAAAPVNQATSASAA
ncbi:MAG: multifunctional CCA addition/repair protein [Rhodoferax sp.]